MKNDALMEVPEGVMKSERISGSLLATVMSVKSKAKWRKFVL